ncbi:MULTISPECIES: hypothetical protein [Stenotrophomonas]|uniref:hypothetical protein n=1 Tax=Stenotrophomonas TaxID=40323 RepID=UPI001312EF99|nr:MULTISPECIES: hypothetical protein [Stenotrophomonas]MCU1000760.1 hypothetical protein [Stenotrophomonas maltophilia]MCU1069362.1 hypothetical protein [Stenotrophomonas maltophilia]MCU1074109.1 hypothetical protein [Stenotrophomonas maltophilia]MCU1137946.1 hypothetical protein [Stenotrophomonas maltophilia]
MASGYRSSGIDFDDLFDPYVEGPMAQDSGRRVGGTDLSRRYAHIQYGSKRADVGYRVGGMDVSNLWAARGSATYRLPFHGQAFSASNGAKTNSSGSASASISIDMLSDGNYSIRRSVNGGGNSSNTVVASGRWLPAGANPSEYDVRFSAGNPGAASFGTSAPSFVSLATSRSASVSISVPAASTSYERAAVAVNVHLRRAGGNEQISTFTASVSASGWV